jgi:Rrf2 family protein
MQVTRAVDYGLRALVVMSRKPMGIRFSLQELADDGDLPRNYLVKVLKLLANTGIVQSHRGIKGGFTLGREPEKISMRQIVESIDGPVSMIHCLTDAHSCAKVGMCSVEAYFDRLRSRVLQDMEATSLKEIVDAQEQIDKSGCSKTCATQSVAATA